MSTTDRLSMLDEYGGRKAIIPAEVNGPYRRARDRVYLALLLILLVLPWIQINGLQAVRFDIPGRRFELFGTLFLAHDAPLLFFLFSGFVLALAFVTTVWGRIWCGWACPQTVFIEAVYRRLERWIEGTYIQRRRLREGPWTLRRAKLFTLKWLAYLVVSSVFAHSFIAYFAGSKNLIQMTKNPPGDNWTYFVLVSLVTAGLLFLFGWFREQFCIIMCPYGRFQGLLMDAKSKTIFYDHLRGEPRKGLASAVKPAGDCVACNRCVQVCPTGIDIRNGNQMECISCTACVDACDEIMTKVGKPKGLISYRSPGKPRRILQRPRALIYAGLTAVSLIGLTYSLATRQPFSLLVLRAKESPYQEMPDNKIMNHFKAHILNQSRQTQEMEISILDAASAKGAGLLQAAAPQALKTGEAKEFHFFIVIPRAAFKSNGEAAVKLHVQDRNSGTARDVELRAVGPYSPAGSSAGSGSSADTNP